MFFDVVVCLWLRFVCVLELFKGRLRKRVTCENVAGGTGGFNKVVFMWVSLRGGKGEWRSGVVL